MKLLRSKLFWIFVCVCLAGVFLMHASQKMQESEARLSELQKQIAQEQKNLRVLNAEWSYLNSPSRLEVLVQKYLPQMSSAKNSVLPSADDLPTKNKSSNIHGVSVRVDDDG